MMGEDAYESWRSKRSGVEPPEGFADRVMDAVRGAAPPRAASGRAGLFEALISRSGIAAAVLVVGFGVGALRMGLPLLIVVFSS